MLAVPINSFRFQYSNLPATPTLAHGLSVVPGASDVEGDWTEIASAASITQDILYMSLWIHGGGTSGQQKDHLLDVGWDPAGSTSYVEKIANIICGQSMGPAGGTGGIWFHFPCYIPAGSAIAVRVQGSNATAGTVSVTARFFGQPTRPEMWRSAQHFETIGTITGSAGVSFTPGNSGSEGTWVSLGTTTRPLWWWQLCVQLSNGTAGNLAYNMDLAFGDATNKHMIIENALVKTTSSEEMSHHLLAIPAYCEVPAGAELWVRGTCSGSPTSGWNAVAVGAGG